MLGKRKRSGPYRAVKKRRRITPSTPAASRMVIPPRSRGFLRTGGYYGRFNRGGGTELKFFDTALSFNIDSTCEVPATGQITLIPQGDTESTRDGRVCTVKSYQIKGNAQFVPATASNASSNAIIYVVLDTQCNGAAAAVTDVFSSTSVATQLMNLANSGRFRILKKLKLTFNSNAGVTTAYNNVNKLFECYGRCNLPIQFSSTTGAITEIKSNNIFLIAGCENSDDIISIVGVARLRFVG